MTKTALITGGTYGIGREVAFQLADKGFDILILGRSRDKGEEVVTILKQKFPEINSRYYQVDLSSFDDIRSFVLDFDQPLDILINNAGVYLSKLQHNDRGIEKMFAINHLGHFLLTNLLIEKSSKISRIINVSSMAHGNAVFNFDDYNRKQKFSGFGVYGETKLCNIYFTHILAEKLRDREIDVNSVHPGFVASRFGKNNNILVKIGLTLMRPIMINMRRGADTITYLASDDAIKGTTGKYFIKRKMVKSSDISYDDDLAKRLWTLSEELTK